MNLKVDRGWDWKMRLISHTATIVLIAFLSAVAFGGPQLLVITLPLGAIAVAIEIRRLKRDKREVGMTSESDVSTKRRRRAMLLAGCVAVFVVGLIIESLPSQDLHDEYWYLFVAPVMFALIVGGVALLMLAWTFLPRRDGEATPFPPS